MPTASRAVVLLSGGLDSAVTLACAIADGFTPHVISFDYAQRHRAELAAAKTVAQAANVPPERQTVITINLRAIGGSALTSDLPVPKDAIAPSQTEGAGGWVQERRTSSPIPVTYVPARNLIFLSCATALAETIDARDIYIGVNAVDYSGYPDCREPFIRAFEAAANLGTSVGTSSAAPHFHIRTPLIRLSKADIIRRGAELGVNFAHTHSCYDPVERSGRFLACGHCDACLIRAKGFADADVPDPTSSA